MQGQFAAVVAYSKRPSTRGKMCLKLHLTGLDEVMVVVVHCLPDLLGTISIHSCQISTKLVNALFCHSLRTPKFIQHCIMRVLGS